LFETEGIIFRGRTIGAENLSGDQVREEEEEEEPYLM